MQGSIKSFFTKPVKEQPKREDELKSPKLEPLPSKRRKVLYDSESDSSPTKKNLSPKKSPLKVTTKEPSSPVKNSPKKEAAAQPLFPSDSVAKTLPLEDSATKALPDLDTASPSPLAPSPTPDTPKKFKYEDINSFLLHEYDPAKFNITPYRATEGLTYQLLSDSFELIHSLRNTGTGSNKLILTILTNTIRTITYYHSPDLTPALYLILNKVAPDYEGLELGIGDSILMQVICQTYSRNLADIKNDINSGKFSDLGEAAMESRARQRKIGFSSTEKQRLNILQVFQIIKNLALISGKKSQDQKKKEIFVLLSKAINTEVKYLIRTLQKKLRIGVASNSILSALSNAFLLTNYDKDGKVVSDIRNKKEGKSLWENTEEWEKKRKQYDTTIKYAYCQYPSIDQLVSSLLSGDDEEQLLLKCTINPGIPVSPMLAKPTRGITEVLDKFKDIDFTCERKYDGERVQIHRDAAGEIRIYSRNSENITEKYPDLISNIQLAINKEHYDGPFIIDGEAVAYDSEKKKILPFQVLMSRKRKDVKIEDIKIRAIIYAFDCLYGMNRSLLQDHLMARRTLLRQMFVSVDDTFYYAEGRDFICPKSLISTSALEDKEAEGEVDEEKREENKNIYDPSELIQAELDLAIQNNCEGLMVKSLFSNATYESNKRSNNWLKVKKDYINGLVDSIDVVPIAGYYGVGKRSGVIGAYLLAVRNEEDDTLETLCKAGTGFSDENLNSFSEFFSDKTMERKPANVTVNTSIVKPDIWLDPCVTWEVRFADLTVSPVHTSAFNKVQPNKGIAARFPRFIRVREDKSVDQCTTAEQIVDMYNNQFQGDSGEAAQNSDDDFIN